MRFGGVWKVMGSRDSGESFPEGNDAVAATSNLEVIFIVVKRQYLGDSPSRSLLSFPLKTQEIEYLFYLEI